MEVLAGIVGLFIFACYALAVLALIAAVVYVALGIVLWIMGGL